MPRCQSKSRMTIHDPIVQCKLEADPPGTIRPHEHFTNEGGWEYRWRDDPTPGEGHDE